MEVSAKALVLLLVFYFGSCCSEKITKIGDREVRLFHTEETFINAYLKCKSHGMQMVVVEDFKKYSALLDLSKEFQIVEFWIGAIRLNNIWMWLPSGQPLRFTAWPSDEPEAVEERNCAVHYFKNKPHAWGNFNCNYTFSFICEESDEHVALQEKEKNITELITKAMENRNELEKKERSLQELMSTKSNLLYQMKEKDNTIEEFAKRRITNIPTRVEKPQPGVDYCRGVEMDLKNQMSAKDLEIDHLTFKNQTYLFGLVVLPFVLFSAFMYYYTKKISSYTSSIDYNNQMLPMYGKY